MMEDFEYHSCSQKVAVGEAEVSLDWFSIVDAGLDLWVLSALDKATPAPTIEMAPTNRWSDRSYHAATD